MPDPIPRSPEESGDALADFSTTLRMLPIALLASAIGIVTSYVALGLLKLIGLFTNLFFYARLKSELIAPSLAHWGYASVAVPVLGGLLIGLIARYGSERIRGHGIPEALEAILIRGSRVEPKLALLKPLSAAISIGSGGPFGAEGPIIMTGGAVGSLIAQGFHLTSAERKTLLVAGAAGGMTATFGSPLAALLLAVELLLFEWKPRSFVPVALAAATAMATRHVLMPDGALFSVPAHARADGALGLAASVVVGLGAGVLSASMTRSVYFFEDLFEQRLSRLHWMWWPGLAGLVIGVGGLLCPRALGVGYESIAELLAGRLDLGAIALLVVVKWFIWSFALGSGTSGGVLAPLLMMGAALGALESHLLPQVGAGFWPLVSMGATLAGTMRSPLTGILFALEVTHDWDAILPLTVAAVVAHAFSVLVLRRSILTEKVSRRGYHITREYGIDPLEVLFVREVMQGATAHAALSPAAPFAYADEPLRAVVQRMAQAEVARIAVVSRGPRRHVVGELTLENVLAARRQHIEQETRRERVLPVRWLVPVWARAGRKPAP